MKYLGLSPSESEPQGSPWAQKESLDRNGDAHHWSRTNSHIKWLVSLASGEVPLI